MEIDLNGFDRKRICPLEQDLIRFRIAAETLEYSLNFNGEDTLRIVNTNAEMILRDYGLPILDLSLTSIEKAAVVANLVSNNAYHRLNEIEKIDGAIPEKNFIDFLKYSGKCIRLLYNCENPTNLMRISRELISVRREIADDFKTHNFH